MPTPRLPSLNAVRAFEAAARLGSFVAAAAELHVSQPAIGRHVKLLEDALCTTLFARTPRGVVLTHKGRTYFEQVNRALIQIAEASYELSVQARQNWLRLVVVPGFALRWLRLRLPAFRAHNPELRITLEPNPSFTSLLSSQADLGIAFGTPHEFQVNSELLIRPPIFPVCSPAFLNGNSHKPKKPADLLRLSLLHEDNGDWWSQWFLALGVRAQPTSDIGCDSGDYVIEQALAGEGIALTNSLLVADQLADGSLVRPLPSQCVLDGYFLLSPTAGLKPHAKLFRQWLIEELGH